MTENFEINGNVVDVNGQPANLYWIQSIIQKLASKVTLSKPEEFCINEPFVFPKTTFHAVLEIDSYTDISKKEIHIYLGLILIFCKLGSLEKALRGGFGVACDELVKLHKKDVANDIRKIFEYMQSLHNRKDNVIVFPEININSSTYEIMVAYIYGHELSHYLDDIFHPNLRVKHQVEVLKYATEYLTLFKNTSYQRYAAEILFRLDQDMQMERFKMIQRWSEELLADFQAYQFCFSICEAEEPRERAQMCIAISMVFAAIRIHEVFKENFLKSPTNIYTHPPVFLRDQFLGYIVNKKIFPEREYKDFLNTEWSVSLSAGYLLAHAMSEVIPGS
jgi:hypothetical protein